jgi:hypothetical protein
MILSWFVSTYASTRKYPEQGPLYATLVAPALDGVDAAALEAESKGAEEAPEAAPDGTAAVMVETI